MSWMTDALSIHADLMGFTQGEAITYQCGDLTIEIALAVRGATAWDQVEATGEFRGETRAVDWIIKREDFFDPANGLIVEPKVGGFVTDAKGLLYEVVPGLSPTGWRWSNSYRTHYRIHTALSNESIESAVGIGVMGIGSSFIVNS